MMKWLKRVGVALGLVAIFVAAQFIPVKQAILQHLPPSAQQIIQTAQKPLYTFGVAGVAYAVTPDYVVDGINDDAQAQTALGLLPATGGELLFYGGNYSFDATVLRAINNVTISGSGMSTYFAHDGATPIFSAGAQTGWVFQDFRTDAGWLTLASDTRLLGALWKGTELVSNVVASGATMPASPVKGQQFYQNTTGRDVLYTYNGSAWVPLRSFGPMTLYVDATDGTDDQNHGTGVDANAFKTIQYALNFVALDTGGDVYINVNSETYNESLVLFNYTHRNIIQVTGTLSLQKSGTLAAGSVQGTGATQGTAVDNAGGMGVNAYGNMWIKMTSGTNNGLYRVVDSNTANTFTIVGTWSGGAPALGDTYEIYTSGTQITGTTSLDATYTKAAFFNIYFNGSTIDGHYYECSDIGFCRVKFNGYVGIGGASQGAFYQTVFLNGATGCPLVSSGSTMNWSGCKSTRVGGGIRLAWANNGGGLIIQDGSVLDGLGTGASYGLMVEANSYSQTLNYAASGYVRIRAVQGGDAVYASAVSSITGTANNQYSGNTRNEYAVAAAYAYID